MDKDIEANEAYKKAIAEYDRIVSMTKKEKEEEGIFDFPSEPQLTKYVVSDITPESLSSILSVNVRGIAYYADELAAWFNNFNRYNKGSEEQFWLMAYSASPIQINRQNMRGSISIKRPYISVTGTIQPGAEGVEKDVTVKTRSFVDMTVKLSYFFNLNATNKVEINGGIQNMFNQIQKDYDKGPNRDSEYIYGPSLPRTFFIGLKISSI